MIKVIVSGVTGRMGKSILDNIEAFKDIKLVGAITHEHSKYLNKSTDELSNNFKSNILITSNAEDCIVNADLIIDFSTPHNSLKNIELCHKYNKKIVIGTTGFTENELDIIHNFSKNIPILLAPNFSIGVNVMLRLVQLATQVLGSKTDIEIIEAHHSKKVDAPSGTAIRIGEVIAEELNCDLSQLARYSREGLIGERKYGEIGFSTIRAGGIIGDHSTIFADEDELIEINHKALNRSIFAKGALKAAQWLIKSKTNGLFDMRDVIGLNK